MAGRLDGMSNDQWNSGQNNQWAPQQQPSASEWGQQGQASANEWQAAQQQGSAGEWGQQQQPSASEWGQQQADQGSQGGQQGADWGQQAAGGDWPQGQSANEWGQQQADQTQAAAQHGWDPQQQQQGWDQAQQQGWDPQQQQGWDQAQQQQGWDPQQQQQWNQQQSGQWQGGPGYAAGGAVAQQQASGGSALSFDFSRFSLPKSASLIYIIGIIAIGAAWLFRFIGLFTGDVQTPFGTIDTDPSALVVVQTLVVGLLEAAFYILILRVGLEGVIALIRIAEKKPSAQD